MGTCDLYTFCSRAVCSATHSIFPLLLRACPPLVGRCPSLRRLWLFSNRITLLEGLHYCGALQELLLHGNRITKVIGLESLVHLQVSSATSRHACDFWGKGGGGGGRKLLRAVQATAYSRADLTGTCTKYMMPRTPGRLPAA